MKVMVIVKATANSEAGVMPSTELLTAMGAFNEALVNAGIMKDGDGLKPSRFGARVTFANGEVLVTDGPFAETKELIAGYWLWEVASMDEALAWAKRCPHPMPGEVGVLELRPFYTAEDFGEAFTEELRAAEEALRARAT